MFYLMVFNCLWIVVVNCVISVFDVICVINIEVVIVGFSLYYLFLLCGGWVVGFGVWCV